MNAPEKPERNTETDAPSGSGFVAQYSLVERLPAEVVPTISRLEFQALQGGEVSTIRAGRDLCIGIAFSALFGSIGLCFTIDWDASFHLAHWKPFIWTGLMFAITAASTVGAVIYGLRYNTTLNCSVYSTTMKRLTDHFSKQESRTPPE
ncbi:MAG: hypothetical protein ACLPXT_12800 [Terracidiphilus sp.]